MLSTMFPLVIKSHLNRLPRSEYTCPVNCIQGHAHASDSVGAVDVEEEIGKVHIKHRKPIRLKI